MLISFSMPVRKHYDMTVKSIKSLVDNVDDISRIEVILRLDTDDDIMLSKYNDLCKLFPKLIIKKVVGDKYNGWADSHIFHYENCKVAEFDSEFIQLWSDDAIMMTKGFDTIIKEKYSNKISVVTFRDSMNWTSFPMVNKKIIDVIESFGLSTFCDCYLVDLGTANSILFYDESIYVEHDRYDVTGNNNHEEYILQQNTQYQEAMRENNSPRVRELKRIDAEKINNYLKSL
jgi:hypothetical protein